MAKGLIDRWNDRETYCVICGKKLVGNEKYLCKRCKNDLGITGEITAAALFVFFLTKIPKIIKHFRA